MTEYRDPRDAFNRKTSDEAPEDSNNRWSIIAGILFLVVVAALALGVGHKSGQVASTDINPPTTLPSTPPGNPAVVPTSPPAPAR
jgi:hypothetical protein